ncbi:hypothetical protein ACOSP7_004410 [Xanthoceras sorbifolium]
MSGLNPFSIFILATCGAMDGSHDLWVAPLTAFCLFFNATCGASMRSRDAGRATHRFELFFTRATCVASMGCTMLVVSLAGSS